MGWELLQHLPYSPVQTTSE